MDSSDVTAGTNATASQYNNLRKDLVLAKKKSGTHADGATITIDWSDTTKALFRDVGPLGGNRTIAFSNPTVDQVLIMKIMQDGTGGRTLTWPSFINWPNDLAISLSSGANKYDYVGFRCLTAGGTPTYDAFILGQNYDAT